MTNVADASAPIAAAVAGWPDEPYKGLAYYRATDRRLFSGRDADVDGCARRLSAPETRILLIHGRTGCGKSSFLRAGLIPELDEAGSNFLFLPGEDGAPLFIRCGADPLGRIAEQLFRFASAGVAIRSPRGPVHFDLSSALLGHPDRASFTEACRRHGQLKECLHRISRTLPCTLVVILDQAEEVITLSDPARPWRRQFFHFVKEFGSVNFPVKLVLALRKDYSGQFVELAQMGGGIDLREPAGASRATSGAVDQDLSVKADVKLYLLDELSPAKVRQAIELPTEGRDTPDEPGAAYRRYRFRYAPTLAERIVADLFKKSSTAVLPVMQIVCRELYQKRRPGADEPPATIELDEYLRGGDISGPVDRHISHSLRASFAQEASASAKEVAVEEDRWREVLFKFVRLESDGTAHTRFVDEQEFREFARVAGATADVERVIEHLTRNEVLLLRRVPSDTNAGKVPGLSLGHDYLAMVLNRWKLARQEVQAARDRATKLKRTLRRGVMVAGLSVVALGLFTAHVLQLGGKESQYDVLLKAIDSTQRTRPMLAAAIATYATTVADDVQHSQLFMARRDDQADRKLAELLATMPMTGRDDEPASLVGPQADAVVTNVPLRKSRGFLALAGDRARLSIGDRSRSFELAPMDVRASAGFGPSIAVSVSEVADGTVALLRADGADPRLAFQLYVLGLDGRTRGPFGPADFPDGLPGPVAVPESDAWPEAQQALLSGSVLVLQGLALPRPAVSSAVSIRLRAYAYDGTRPGLPYQSTFAVPRLDPDPNQGETGGLRGTIFVGDDLITPRTAAVSPAAAGSSGLAGLVRYRLSTSQTAGVDLLDPRIDTRCPGGCEWRFASQIGADVGTVVFGGQAALAGGEPPGSRAAGSGARLDDFRALLIIELPSGRATVIDHAALEAARCGPRDARPVGSDGAARFAAGPRIVVMQATAGPMLALVGEQSTELLQLTGSGAAASGACLGWLSSPFGLDRWTVSEDRTRLLGGGPGPGARAIWDLTSSVEERRARLMKAGHLRDRACEAGIGDRLDEVADATHLPLNGQAGARCKLLTTTGTR